MAQTQRIDVAVGVLVDRNSHPLRVLIARRRHDTVLGGFWEWPGGKIEPGESAVQCLVREFEEELGLIVRVTEPLAYAEHHYDHGLVRLHPFFCARVSGSPRNLAVAEHRWVSAAELERIDFPPGNATLTRHVIAALTPAVKPAR